MLKPTALDKVLGILFLSVLISRSASAGNFDFKITVMLNDTANISAIEVKLGNAVNSSNLLNYTFVYDTKTGLPTGTAYLRKQKDVSLTLGNFPDGVPMYGEYKIKDKNGNVILTKNFMYK